MDFNHPLAELIDDQLGADFPIEDPIPAKPVLWAAGLGLLAWMLLRKSDTEGQALSAEVKEKIVYMNERLIPAQEISEELGIDIKDVESVISEKKIKLELPERKRHFITAPLGVQVENPIQEENPKAPKDYMKLFEILQELMEKAPIRIAFNLDDIRDEQGIKRIIDFYKRNDRIDSYYFLLRFMKLSRYLRNLGSMIRGWVGAGTPSSIDDLKMVVNDSLTSRAFAMWKNYYDRLHHISADHPLRGNYSSFVYEVLRNEFPENTWQRNALEDYLQGEGVFGLAYDEGQQYLDALDHFMSYMNTNSDFMRAAGNIVWKPYDIRETISELREKENEFREMGAIGKRIQDDVHENIFLDMGDWKWVVADPQEESRMMQHCARERQGAILLSLRHYDKKKGMIYAHVTAAFYPVKDDTPSWGFITQMKGRLNNKPSFKYHPYIIQLFKDSRIAFKLPGDYKPEADFQFEDLDKMQLEDLIKTKPELFSLVLFKEKKGLPETLKLLSAFNVNMPVSVRVENNVIVFDSWESEDDFIRGIYSYVDRDTHRAIKSTWDWIDEQYLDVDFGGEIPELRALFDQITKEEFYAAQVNHYLKTLHPDLSTESAFELILDDKRDPLNRAFLAAEREGLAVGWRDNAQKEFLASVGNIEWSSGAFINVNHSPFKIEVLMNMDNFDRYLSEIKKRDDILGEYDSNSQFHMNEVWPEYNQDAALNYLKEIALPEALRELEDTLKKQQKKIFREEMEKIGARPENIEEENPLELTDRQIEWAKEGVEGIAFYKIDPKEFLQLTTDSMGEREYIKERAKPLEIYNSEEFKKGYSVHPHLTIAPSGKVVTHEGRHRAAALIKKGEKEMPVVIVARESEYLDPGFGWRWKRQLPLPKYLYAQYPAGDPNTYRHTIDKSKIEIIPRQVRNPKGGKKNERLSMGSGGRNSINDTLSKALKKYTKGRGHNRNAKNGSNRRTRKIGKSPKRGSDGRFTKRS